MKRLIAVMFLVFIVFSSSMAMARTPLGGLTVALSPNEKVMAAAGDNRTLFILDPAKLEVIQRVWLGVCIVNLAFNRDSSMLLAEDTEGTIHLLDVNTWQVQKKLVKAANLSAAHSADLAAGLNPDYKGQIIQIYAMTDLSLKGEIKFDKSQKVAALSLDEGGNRLAVLMESVKDESEPKGDKPPADLKGLALEEFKLKNDGKTSLVMVFNVSNGEKISENKVYYSPSITGVKLLFQGDNVLSVNYSNINAVISPAGEVTLFGLDNSFNYGIGIAPDQSIILSGGLSEGTYTKTADLTKTVFKPDRLSGWPEYFKAFTVAKDGTAYGATSAYRIIKIKPGGAFDRSVPVY